MEAVLYFQRTLKKEGRAFRSIGNNNYYIPDCKISLASFARYFNLSLIRSFIYIRIETCYFVTLVLATEIEFKLHLFQKVEEIYALNDEYLCRKLR